MLDLLADLLDQALRRGATSGDAFVVADQSFSAQVRLGQVDTVKHAREQHLSLRVFVGKSVAASSTSDLSPDSVTRLVDEAVSLARITSPDELSGLPDAALIARDLPHLDLSDATGHDLEPDRASELVRDAELLVVAPQHLDVVDFLFGQELATRRGADALPDVAVGQPGRDGDALQHLLAGRCLDEQEAGRAERDLVAVAAGQKHTRGDKGRRSDKRADQRAIDQCKAPHPPGHSRQPQLAASTLKPLTKIVPSDLQPGNPEWALRIGPKAAMVNKA